MRTRKEYLELADKYLEKAITDNWSDDRKTAYAKLAEVCLKMAEALKDE